MEIELKTRKVQVGDRTITLCEIEEGELEFQKLIKWFFLSFGILLGIAGVIVYLVFTIESCVGRVW